MRFCVIIAIMRTATLRHLRRCGVWMLAAPVVFLAAFALVYLTLGRLNAKPHGAGEADHPAVVKLPGAVLLAGGPVNFLEKAPALTVRRVSEKTLPAVGELLVHVPADFETEFENNLDGRLIYLAPPEDDTVANRLAEQVTMTVNQHRAAKLAAMTGRPEWAKLLYQSWRPTVVDDAKSATLFRLCGGMMGLYLLSGLGMALNAIVTRERTGAGLRHLRLAGASAWEILFGLCAAVMIVAVLMSISVFLLLIAGMCCMDFGDYSILGGALWFLLFAADIILVTLGITCALLVAVRPDFILSLFLLFVTPTVIAIVHLGSHPILASHPAWFALPVFASVGPGISLIAGVIPPILPWLAGIVLRLGALAAVLIYARPRIGREPALRSAN